ncbi:MAG: IS110 family transposase [Candidatus Latescibacteria bacterium]|jgi:transposase|nr:IS110 family transposase [Gemmatimonadaceae bacterium]MDP7450360.1 IS110 family transposase [Candidatus Latescibacterota bacterium]|tara:strand:- start:119 stop:1213 length:1095 start_codon:yes stop_codon:yes gene_type:complete
MRKTTKIVALDQHMESMTVALLGSRQRTPVIYGNIANTPAAVAKLARGLDDGKTRLRFCYEAGPCGYGVFRQLTQMGHECTVVAPSMIPRRPGERIKTDRRDAASLARLHRLGERTPVWVPDEEQEAIRDLVRCREDAKHAQRRVKQRLNSFLLRHGRVHGGRSRWTQAHFRWLEQQSFDHPAQQIAFEEYVDAVKDAGQRVAQLETEMSRALDGWSLEPVVRGVDLIVAMTVMSELGDLTRFDSPAQLMAYVGLVPSEHSSGRSRRQGAITRTGNGHVRRVLAQSAWCYNHPARKTAALQRKAEKTSLAVQDIAWKAQKRLCHRFYSMMARGKTPCKVATAVGRELLGFIWAIACETMPRQAA